MAPTFPWIGLIFLAVSGASFISFVASPLIAWRKGYAPYLWLFACGPIGLIVIACLPAANTAQTPEQMELMQARANTTGAILTGLALVISAMLIVPAILIGV